MRILMLTQTFPPMIGGEAQHVRNLSIELVKHGHSVAVATICREKSPTFALDEGVRVYHMRGTLQHATWAFRSPDRQPAAPFPDPQLMLALRRVIAVERPQIVHAHNWMVHSFLPLKQWSRAALVVTLHNYGLRCARLSLMHHDTVCSGPGLGKCLECARDYYGQLKTPPIVVANWAMSLAERRAVDLFVPVSRAVAAGNALTAGNLPFEVIPNFIPDTVNAPQEAPAGYLDQAPAQPFLLYVGALGRIKGIDTLLRAYAGLRNAPPLVLAGYRTPDFAQATRVMPDHVTIVENWPHSAVMEGWRRSYLALAPSVWPEPCPTVVMEAMAAGRPVIASRIGGMTDMVADGETGYLVPPGDADALRGAIERLLADGALWTRMSQAARDKSSAFFASAVVPRIEQAYTDVLKRVGAQTRRYLVSYPRTSGRSPRSI